MADERIGQTRGAAVAVIRPAFGGTAFEYFGDTILNSISPRATQAATFELSMVSPKYPRGRGTHGDGKGRWGEMVGAAGIEPATSRV